MIKKILIYIFIITSLFFIFFLQHHKWDDLESRVSSLESEKSDLESRVSSLESEKDDLESRIDNIESHINYR